MTNQQKSKPTSAELKILQVLWAIGPATVKQVNQVVCENKEVVYTTTLKIMQIMVEKNLLKRHKKGKTHIYRPAEPQEKTQKQLLDKFIDTTFQGSATNLVMQLLGNRKSTKKEIEEIREFLDKIEKEGNI